MGGVWSLRSSLERLAMEALIRADGMDRQLSCKSFTEQELLFGELCSSALAQYQLACEDGGLACCCRYGQCWVLAGVCVSLLRALGLASRPVTCYNAAHVCSKLGQVDKHFTTDGELLDDSTGDRIW